MDSINFVRGIRFYICLISIVMREMVNDTLMTMYLTVLIELSYMKKLTVYAVSREWLLNLPDIVSRSMFLFATY